MRNVSARFCTLAAALTALAVTCYSPAVAHGQSAEMRVNVPFDFYVGNEKLPAGQYSVVRHTDAGVIHLSDASGHSLMSLSNPVTNRSTTLDGQMIFNRYWDRYFLSEVRWTGSSVARQLAKSSFEVLIAKSRTAERVATTTRNQ